MEESKKIIFRKKNLEHLPKEKQDELELITNIIVQTIPDVRMIVLFGSYARVSIRG